MATTYSIEIDLHDKDTLEFLHGKSLFAFKGVKTDGQGLPTVWVEISSFANSTKFSWSESYGAYVQDGGTPAAGVRLVDLSINPLNLGQRLVASDDGQVDTDNKGRGGAILVQNGGKRDWTCGMGQMVNNKLAPICAFDLGGVGEKILMMPYEKVVLVIGSSSQMDVGTVVATALSASITIELDGNDPTRTVIFRKDTGWTTNQEGWVTINDDNLDLAPVLVVPNT